MQRQGDTDLAMATIVPDAAIGTPDPHSLQGVLAVMQVTCSRNHGTKVSVGDLVKAFGPRSFAPFLLAVGLIAVTPIDTIPTLPTTFGVIVFMTVGQLLLGRQSLWLPAFIAGRAVNADRLKRALLRLEPYARRVDRWLGVRLVALTQGASLTMIALSCLVMAALMPLMEFLPFVSTIPSLAFTAFGIALLMHDGLAALVGFGLSALTLLLMFELVKLPF
jgi:hypothetical protein